MDWCPAIFKQYQPHLLVHNSSIAKQDRYSRLALDIADLIDDELELFSSRFSRFEYLSTVGQRQEAEDLWQLLDPMGRDWPRHSYVSGDAEVANAWFRFEEGSLSESQLTQADTLVRSGKNRLGIRTLLRLRGKWHLQHSRWSSAADSFSEAVEMARAVGQSSPELETLLALAKLQLGVLSNPHQQAEQLAAADSINNQAMAELWFAIGDPVQAERYALQAYVDAWADGEPHVLRYDLNRARDLLNKLGAEIPNMAPYDPTKDEKFLWEDELVAAIEKLREKKQAEAAAETSAKSEETNKERDRD